MTIDWGKLAEPFPDSEIKQRPGPGNRQLSYVDARAVAQRLDDVLTPAGWSFFATALAGSEVVHGKLIIPTGDGMVATREDHGYPNSDRDEEPIKAATSDALKRCAVLFGVGRHLYDDNASHRPSRPQTAQAPRQAPQRPPVAARSSTAVPDPVWEGLTPPTVEQDLRDRRAAPPMTSSELFSLAEKASLDKRLLTETAKRIFGQNSWRITNLTDEQRQAIAEELELVPA